MPVTYNIIETKYYTEYKNDVGFGSNLGDFTPNLAGSVMGKVKRLMTVNVDWRWGSQASAGDGLITVGEISAGVLQMKRGAGKLWANDGFAVGDRVLLDWDDATSTIRSADATITSITGNILIMSWAGYPAGSLNGWVLNSTSVIGLEPLEALIYKFGLLGTNESFNVSSKVSGNDQSYYAGGIGLGYIFPLGGRSTAFVNMTKVGQYSDWKSGNCRVRYVQDALIWQGRPLTQQFEIEHEFMILPFFVDGELSNLQNNVIPQLLNGLNSLKYVYGSEFRTQLSNPNSSKIFDYEESLGAVGWYNENFNGFLSNYQVDNVTYQEQATLATANGLLIGTKTRITIELQKLVGNFVIGDKVGVYVSYLPQQSEYTNTVLSNIQDNFLYDNAFGISGGAGTIGVEGIITAVAVANPSTATTMTLTFDVEYSPLQKAFLSSAFNNNPIKFLIGVEVGDNSLTNGGSDRVMLLADVELYDQSPDISDLMHVTKYDIYPHNQQIGLGVGFSDMVSWNEDGLVVDFEFDLNLNLSALLNSLEFKIVAYNTVTNQFFELDSYSFSPATAVVSNGVQQINANTTHNYILETGDQFNDVIINVGTQAGGLQKYNGRFSQKISWQDWIANNGVDTIFYDSTEPNDNFNNKASNYSVLNNYEIRLAILGNVFGTSPLNVSGITDYLFLSPNIKIWDYEEDGNIPPTWSCLIETFDAVNLTPLSGAIMSGQDTLFRVTWTSINAPITSLNLLWGINRIEITDQQGYAITEMSSLNLPLPTGQQLLKPTTGTLLDVQILGGNVVFECLIDGSLITTGTSYNLSSRIHKDSIPLDVKLTSPDNQSKDATRLAISGLIIDTKIIAP